MFIETLCSLDTGYYADTVEWCPVEGCEELVVCGTYQLLEQSHRDTELESASSNNIRVGNVQLYRLVETTRRLEKLQTLETAGVLDTKWLPHSLNGCAVLGVATSDGEVKIFSTTQEQLVEKASHTACQGKLCLSMDWSPENDSRSGIVSDSGGQLTLLKFCEGSNQLFPILQWTAHQYEAWITAFDAWNSSIVYSGGDDCLLQGWDTRANCGKPVFTNKRHEMGVSSIQCNQLYQNVMATGSYDEKILLWDTRNMKHPLCSSNPGGGVWRIKWHPDNGQSMLTACMHEGFHVLKFNNNSVDRCLVKLTSYREQTSLAYGADWCRKQLSPTTKNLEEHRGQPHEIKDKIDEEHLKLMDLVATCSFYDHALHLWTVAS